MNFQAPKQNSFTFVLTEQQQALLVNTLRTGNYRPAMVPHTIIAAETPDCRINLYKSGKCLIQGKGASEFVTFVLEPQIIGAAQLGYEELLNPEAFSPHIGVDESGKGDFFGPLVIASAFVDRPLIKEMQQMGVKDSKQITSDTKAMQLDKDIRKLLDKKFSLVIIGPQAYNRLYSKMSNLNTMLAWGHARAIENLLEVVPHCKKAISDQFGNKRQVEQPFTKKGTGLELLQMHRAESAIAVPAASILARGTFLNALKKMGEEFSVKIPKGASSAVLDTAVELAKIHGPAMLINNVKCHFKTTDKVLEKLKVDRSVLGEYGQVVSKPYTYRKSSQAGK
ncbi:MAG: ribonuclease HIII [Lentisphaerae bacterium]|nr:ribonuclease HIII [Lentisphaerota bacterium]